MPKLSSAVEELPVHESRPETFARIQFSGFVDAGSYAAFEKALEAVHQKGGKLALVDLSGLNYINSTGISALIRFFGLYRERNGLLCLASVPKPVGLSMHLLGVTSLIPFLKDVEAGRKHFVDFLEGRLELEAIDGATHPGAATAIEGAGGAGEAARGAGRGAGAGADVETAASAGAEGGKKGKAPPRKRIALRRKDQDLAQRRVLLVHPSRSRFSRILRLRFQRLNGHFHLVHDTREALERFDELNPDLVVLDSRLDPKGEFVTRIKINKAHSLTSVIKIYGKAADVDQEMDFKIWENDYLVDPFEVLELFTLAESELLRVPRDRKVFQQQVRFSFRASPENVEKANKLSDLIVRQSIANEEDQTALFAAVKEAIDNAVIHGDRRDPALVVDVNFLVDRSKVTVMVEDQGKGFDYEFYLSRIDGREAFEKAKRRILSGGQRGGLGILLMHKCCDRLEYSGSGNVVRMEKNISGR